MRSVIEPLPHQTMSVKMFAKNIMFKWRGRGRRNRITRQIRGLLFQILRNTDVYVCVHLDAVVIDTEDHISIMILRGVAAGGGGVLGCDPLLKEMSENLKFLKIAVNIFANFLHCFCLLILGTSIANVIFRSLSSFDSGRQN